MSPKGYPSFILKAIIMKHLFLSILLGLFCIGQAIAATRQDIRISTNETDLILQVAPNGHQYAMLRSLRKTSRVSAVDEILNGLTQIFCLHELAEADPKNNSAVFNEILRQIKAGGGFIHVTAEPLSEK